MKTRPIKDWLFFAFIALGIACSLILPLTIMTYLDYAESGYGLEAEVDGYTIGSNDNVQLMLELTNPGKLKIQITGIQWNLAGSDEWFTGSIPGEIYDIEGGSSEDIIFIFSIPNQAVSDSLLSGQVEYELQIEIYIPYRDAYTTFIQSGSAGVV
ncbi:MAG: hypothetical protein KAS16_09200 [Thermoplasmata archaeon]|nr:hypothetical protein [Thermoplasmata archaeon]